MLYRITHRTRYCYEAPVVSGQHLAHLAPRQLPHQTLSSFNLSADPLQGVPVKRRDYFGNTSHCFEVGQEHRELLVTATSVVVLRPPYPFEPAPGSTGGWEEARAMLSQSRAYGEVQEFRFDSPLVRRHSTLAELTLATFSPGRDLYEAAVAFNEWLHRSFRYDPTATEVSTPLSEVLKRRAGVCQDFAHVAVGCLRSIGLAARYVSGYLETQPPPGIPRLVGADASHAWASVFIPAIGWLDFDPTNGVLPNMRHITVGWGRDFSDVTPLKGVVLGGGTHTVEVGVDVEPRKEAAESTVAQSA